MTIQLSPEHEQLVKRLIESGDYSDVDDIVAEALALLERRRHFHAEVEQSLAQLDRGERIPADEVFEEIYTKAAKMRFV